MNYSLTIKIMNFVVKIELVLKIRDAYFVERSILHLLSFMLAFSSKRYFLSDLRQWTFAFSNSNARNDVNETPFS